MGYPVADFLRAFCAFFVDCLILKILGELISSLIKKNELYVDAVIKVLTKGEINDFQKSPVFLSINLFVLALFWRLTIFTL